jgi:hypothetical protein
VTLTDVAAPVRVWKAEGSEWLWWCNIGYCMHQCTSQLSQVDALNQALEHLTTNHAEPTA